MNKAEVIKGIDITIAGLTTIKNALAVEVTTEVETPKKSKSVERREKSQEVNPTVEETEGSDVAVKFDVEQLNSMKYNEFKKFAASLGVKCTGTRDEIMERILALESSEDDAEVVESVEESVEKEVKPVKKAKMQAPAKDEFDEQAEAIAEETPVEDIIEALAEVDVKANKKNAVSLLADALREGLIELDDEDEEDVEDDEEVEVVEAEIVDEDEEDDITAMSYFPEFDPKGFNKPEDMTDERAEAVVAKMDEILTAYSEEELTDEDVASYVEDNATEEEIELLGDEYDEEDILKLYMELVKRTIDNEGEEHEQGEPYEVADKDVCCGQELKYSKKTKKYICEHCGTEYEAE